ncbi:transposase [Colwellia sp. E2M01]|uniref:REP-associated tyrosine transposase n=1 Tax=Colwellia sp. E2M01 TaxID=2841561 RepID=UPI001C095487|nr:transposase [Colwellia sp. E2M01]MBU2869192.1 transposase [Colwellia sp. E2M01]
MTLSVGYKQLRKGRNSCIGFTYHITFTTHNRQPVFSDLYTARLLISIMHSDGISSKCDTLSFVIMPDHIHWLLELKEGEVSSLIQRVKSLFTKKHGRCIWQNGFYDHGIRSDEALIDVARYIVANPLRAGLVKNIKDYPYWDSSWLN